MYPRPNPRQRIPPTTRIYGNFGPYGTRELEMARSTLVGSVYQGTGEILSRVKMKCGILPTYNGTYRGCEPHPITNVSFESQSCELMRQDSIPWLKTEDGRAGNGEFSGTQIDRGSEFDRSHGMHDNDNDMNIFYEDYPPRYEQSFDRRDSWNNGGRNDSEGRPRSREGGARISGNSKETDMFEENPSGKREKDKLYQHDDARDYRNRPSTSTEKPGTPTSAELSNSAMKIKVPTLDQNRSVSEMVHDRESLSSETKPTSDQNQSVSEIVPDTTNLSKDTKPDRKRKRQENVLESVSEKSKKYKDSVEIVSSDDSDDCKIDEAESTFVCFKCDLCDFTSTKGSAVQEHLKSKMHYSASKYIGARSVKSIVPSLFVKSMAFRYYRALYKSVIPMCPNCHRIFPNIHMCRSHNQAVHNTESREYGLSDVKEVVVIDLSPAPICSVCKEEFTTISKLNSHATSSGHYFYRKPKDDETIVAFCQGCRSRKKKFQSFYDAQAHVYERHSDCETRVRVSVVFIEKQGKVQVLLPRCSRNKGESLVDEIADTNIAHQMEITKRKEHLRRRNKYRRKKRAAKKL